MTVYSDSFYLNQVSGAYSSGKMYAKILSEILIPESVVDVGCGRGAWLKAFKDFACESSVQQSSTGIDGFWNSKSDLILQDVDYQSFDLNDLSLCRNLGKMDLAISVETAEHIEPSSTEQFVNKLCSLSDVIIFSGAFKDQGGLYHVNERAHSGWAGFFLRNDFSVYDYFRPHVWGVGEVNYWYQQNVYLYVKNGSSVAQTLSELRICPISNLNFMDCVHPQAFKDRSTLFGQFKHLAQKKLPAYFVLAASNLKKKFSK